MYSSTSLFLLCILMCDVSGLCGQVVCTRVRNASSQLKQEILAVFESKGFSVRFL